MKKRNSYPLDLSALAYPMMRSRRAESNFRFSATLTEEVDPVALLQSLEEVLPKYPNLKTKIVTSFFWHKLAENDAPLLVKEDDRPPLTPMRKEDTNRYPFRLAYKGSEIVLEVFHAVTDGNVCVLFLTDLLTRYVEIRKGLEHREIHRDLALGDAFLKHAKKKSLFKFSLRNYNCKRALALGKRGNYLEHPVLLCDEIPLSELKAAAKSHDVTITEYVSACYITAVLEGEKLPLRKPIRLLLPVDLRRFFPSNTLQNFVCFERINLEKGENDASFERVLSLLCEQFRSKITREKMQEHVDDVKLCFTFPLVKYLPLFIKKPCFKLCKKIMDKVRQTAILSNVGTLPLPPETASIVKAVKPFPNISKNTPLNIAVLSCGDLCQVSLTCGLKNSAIPERFFELLRQGKK